MVYVPDSSDPEKAVELNDPAAVAKIFGIDPRHISTETLAKLIGSDHLAHLEIRMKNELKKLSEGQEKVVFLQTIVQTINSFAVKDKMVDISQGNASQATQLMEWLGKAQEMGLVIPKKIKESLSNSVWDVEDKEALLDNLRMTIENWNTNNETQLQLTIRLVSQQDQAYQFMRAIMKPIHEDKQNKARKIHS